MAFRVYHTRVGCTGVSAIISRMKNLYTVIWRVVGAENFINIRGDLRQANRNMILPISYVILVTSRFG